MRLLIAAREHANAPRLPHEILIATGSADAEAELVFVDKTEVISLICARSHPPLTPGRSPALCFSNKKPDQGVEALLRSGVSVAGTICPPTIPLIWSLRIFCLDLNESAWSS